MKRTAEHDPEVLAIVAETIADWRKRKACPDPATHARWNANNENVIRLKAEGRYVPATAGWCDYCGKAVN